MTVINKTNPPVTRQGPRMISFFLARGGMVMIIGHHSSLEVTIAHSGELMNPGYFLTQNAFRCRLWPHEKHVGRKTKLGLLAVSLMIGTTPVAVSAFGDSANLKKNSVCLHRGAAPLEWDQHVLPMPGITCSKNTYVLLASEPLYILNRIESQAVG